MNTVVIRLIGGVMSFSFNALSKRLTEVLYKVLFKFLICLLLFTYIFLHQIIKNLHNFDTNNELNDQAFITSRVERYQKV